MSSFDFSSLSVVAGAASLYTAYQTGSWLLGITGVVGGAVGLLAANHFSQKKQAYQTLTQDLRNLQQEILQADETSLQENSPIKAEFIRKLTYYWNLHHELSSDRQPAENIALFTSISAFLRMKPLPLVVCLAIDATRAQESDLPFLRTQHRAIRAATSVLLERNRELPLSTPRILVFLDAILAESGTAETRTEAYATLNDHISDLEIDILLAQTLGTFERDRASLEASYKAYAELIRHLPREKASARTLNRIYTLLQGSSQPLAARIASLRQEMEAQAPRPQGTPLIWKERYDALSIAAEALSSEASISSTTLQADLSFIRSRITGIPEAPPRTVPAAAPVVAAAVATTPPTSTPVPTPTPPAATPTPSAAPAATTATTPDLFSALPYPRRAVELTIDIVTKLYEIRSMSSLFAVPLHGPGLYLLGNELEGLRLNSLKFLEIIFSSDVIDPRVPEGRPNRHVNLRNMMRQIFSSTKFIPEKFIKELSSKVNKKPRDQIDPYIQGFANALRVEHTQIQPFFDRRDWGGLLRFLVARPDTP